MRNIVEEFNDSCKINRVGTNRADRYVSFKKPSGHMIPILRDLVFNSLNDVPVDPEGIYWDAINEVLPVATKNYNKAIMCKYDGSFVVFFHNVEGLDMCGLRITYNDKEYIGMLDFTSKYAGKEEYNALLALALDYLFRCQNINLIKQLPTEGVIYNSWHENRYQMMDDGFATSLIYSPEAEVDQKAVDAVNAAIDRDVSLDEIAPILPEDPLAKIFAREYTELELAQINALEHRISEMA